MTALDPGRTRRALGLTCERLTDGRYQVEGGAEPHIVERTANGSSCDCPDQRFNGEEAGRIADPTLVERFEKMICKMALEGPEQLHDIMSIQRTAPGQSIEALRQDLLAISKKKVD